MSSIYNYENRDRNYRGEYREDGMPWHGDFGWYEEPDDPIYCNVFQDLDGTWHATVIYIGGYNNVCLTVGEEMELKKRFPNDQDYYKHLWENYRRPMETEYIEDPVFETKAQRELREAQRARMHARLKADGWENPEERFRLLDEETVEEKLAREAAGGVKG